MNRSQLFGGSICITDLMETLKQQHSAFSKSPKNGKVYANILVWINDDEDKYGNNVSLQLSSTKDKRDSEEKVYIGNAKRLETTKPVGAKDIPSDDWDTHVPIKENPNKNETALADKHPASDDLPF